MTIANGVARLRERFPFVAHQNAVARLLDVGRQHRLLCVAHHAQGQRSGVLLRAGPKPEGHQGWRFAAGYGRPQLACFGAFQPLRPDVFDLAGAQHLHRHRPRLAFRIQQAQQRDLHRAIARQPGLARHHEPGGLLDRLQERNDQFTRLDIPIRDQRPQNLVDGDGRRKLNSGLARRALSHLQVHFRIDRRGVFSQARQLGQRSAHTQGQRHMVILQLPAPGEGERIAPASVGDPFAFRGGLRFFRQKAARDRYFYFLEGKRHRCSSDSRGARGQRQLFIAGRRHDGQRGRRHQRRRQRQRQRHAALSRSAGDQRDQLAIQPRLAHQQARGDRNPHPAVLQYIHRQDGPPGRQVSTDPQFVIHARQRGVDRGGIGLPFHREGLRPQGTVLGNRNDNPSRGMRRLLRSRRAHQDEKSCQ